MEIAFRSEALCKELCIEKKLTRKHGQVRANLIKKRLYELKAAECLEDVRNLQGLRLHQHTRKKGQEMAVFSVDLDHPYRLLFIADHDPEPLLPGGGVDWSQVKRIKIIGIEDPHV